MKGTKTTGQLRMNRRDFLLLAGGAVCATTIPGKAVQAAHQQQSTVEFIESECGTDGGTKNRILVTYASRCGSTGGVAEVIGQVLCEAGTPADVRLAGKVSDLSPYRAVVVGGAIRMGNWLPEAVEFMNRHRNMLVQMPTAYFVTCMTMKDDSAENRQKVMAYLEPVRRKSPEIKPVSTGLFAGATDFGKLSFVYRSILKAKGTPEGDFRDWTAIRRWAADTHPALLKI